MKTALVCSGQGAQGVGMGKDLAQRFPECQELFTCANDVLGYDLASICFDGPIEKLTLSSHCQPGIFVVSAACFKALELTAGPQEIACSAGLSLGEWTALHLAGVLGFEDTVRTLEARGRFMQEACDENQGAMTSVLGLTLEACLPICEQSGVQVANINSELQIVLSGEASRIETAETLASEAGAKRVVRLQVAGAFHSALMQSAADKLETFLQTVDFFQPRFPVISNVSGQPHGSADDIRRLMVEQVTQSVQWVDSIAWCEQQGVEKYVECGPGKVLTGLIKRIHKGAVLENVQDCESLDALSAG
jgi:[acyl-carrier-protein] S-malonyltransferase